VDSSSPLPLYHQVAGVLRQRIADSVYPPRSQLAAEDVLAAEFAVSRATIRQAVAQLVEAGLVTRRQGSGTYVEERTPAMLQQRFRGSLGDLIRESHLASGRDVVIEHGVRMPDRVAADLNLPDGTGTVIRRTRLMDGVPFAYTITSLPDELGRGITEQDLAGKALMEVLLERGVELASATQSIRAELADAELSGRIGIALGAPLLYVERVVTDSTGRPVEYVRSWYRGDRYEYSVELDIAGAGGDPYRSLA
jgi:GntR family transcriptional regulator